MAYLMKLMMCLLSGTLVGGSLEAANPQPPSNLVASAQGSSPHSNGDESDIDEDEDSVDRGDATDGDVLIMEEDEDSSAAGVGN